MNRIEDHGMKLDNGQRRNGNKRKKNGGTENKTGKQRYTGDAANYTYVPKA